MKDGKTRWESIRKLQQVYAGRRPTRPVAIMKEDRELTQHTDEVVMGRWHQHFSKLLNQQSEFSDEVVDQMEDAEPHLDLDGPPTEEELEVALSKMKMRKPGGKSGILPELVRFSGAHLWDRLLELMQVLCLRVKW